MSPLLLDLPPAPSPPTPTPTPTPLAASHTEPLTWPGTVHRELPEPGLGLDLLLAAVDHLDTGLILLDVASQVLMANDAARREWAHGGVLALHADGGLGVWAETGQSGLRAAVQAAVHQHRHDLLCLEVGVRSLSVAVQPVFTPGNPTVALLMLGRRQVSPKLMVDMLGIRHQLTTAECRVFTGLVQGRRVADLAAEHGVKVSTVRSQVSSLRAKFGVNRIEDLVRIAAELPPMAPSFRSAMAGSRGTGR